MLSAVRISVDDRMHSDRYDDHERRHRASSRPRWEEHSRYDRRYERDYRDEVAVSRRWDDDSSREHHYERRQSSRREVPQSHRRHSPDRGYDRRSSSRDYARKTHSQYTITYSTRTSSSLDALRHIDQEPDHDSHRFEEIPDDVEMDQVRSSHLQYETLPELYYRPSGECTTCKPVCLRVTHGQ
jgi:hypothetical protein